MPFNSLAGGSFRAQKTLPGKGGTPTVGRGPLHTTATRLPSLKLPFNAVVVCLPRGGLTLAFAFAFAVGEYVGDSAKPAAATKLVFSRTIVSFLPPPCDMGSSGAATITRAESSASVDVTNSAANHDTGSFAGLRDQIIILDWLFDPFIR